MEKNEEDPDKPQKERKITPFEIKQRTYVGGEFSILFGTATYLYIAPMVGYDLVPQKFSVGLSTMYQYYREQTIFGSFSSHAYGGGLFVRYRPWRPLLLQTEFDVYNTNDFTQSSLPRVNVPVFMAGGGYAGSMGDRAYYQIMLMYDFIDDVNNPLPPLFCGLVGGTIQCLPIYLRYGFVIYLG